MKLKLDENIPYRLADLLEQLGHDVDTVLAERLNGKPDEMVWDSAQQAGRFLITQDLDFSNIRRFAPGTHEGVLILRLRDPGRDSLFKRVLEAFQKQDVETWRACFVVISDRKIRILRPK